VVPTYAHSLTATGVSASPSQAGSTRLAPPSQSNPGDNFPVIMHKKWMKPGFKPKRRAGLRGDEVPSGTGYEGTSRQGDGNTGFQIRKVIRERRLSCQRSRRVTSRIASRKTRNLTTVESRSPCCALMRIAGPVGSPTECMILRIQPISSMKKILDSHTINASRASSIGRST
jgi:hypothetical protein